MVQRGSGGGPLFQFSDGRYLTRPRFITALRTALREAGIDATQFAGHSFRIGAAYNGIPLWHPRLNDPDIRSLVQRSLYLIHTDPSTHSNCSLQNPDSISLILLPCSGIIHVTILYYSVMYLITRELLDKITCSSPFTYTLSLGEGRAEPTLWADWAGSPTGSPKHRRPRPSQWGSVPALPSHPAH